MSGLVSSSGVTLLDTKAHSKGCIKETSYAEDYHVGEAKWNAGSGGNDRNAQVAQVATKEVEYLGDTPTGFLRLELKTRPDKPHRDARLGTDAGFPRQDEQVRISRLSGPPRFSQPRPSSSTCRRDASHGTTRRAPRRQL